MGSSIETNPKGGAPGAICSESEKGHSVCTDRCEYRDGSFGTHPQDRDDLNRYDLFPILRIAFSDVLELAAQLASNSSSASQSESPGAVGVPP